MLDLGNNTRAHPSLEPLLEPIDVIRPHERNPRTGDIPAITESVRHHGVYNPLVVQRSSGQIIKGNHTYLALRDLGAERVPVLWLDVDDDEADRILLTDNRTSELGDFDNRLLADLLETLADSPSGLDGTGYDAEWLTSLTAQLQKMDEVPDFKEYDLLLETAYRCPSCGYEWSGSASPVRVDAGD